MVLVTGRYHPDMDIETWMPKLADWQWSMVED
jgi:hypothetical protein